MSEGHIVKNNYSGSTSAARKVERRDGSRTQLLGTSSPKKFFVPDEADSFVEWMAEIGIRC